MNQLLGELEMENALKIMRIWGLTDPVDVCIAAAHLVIRQEAVHFCSLNRKPVWKDNAFAALAGAITKTPFLDVQKLSEITAELERLTTTFQKLDSWITKEKERLDRLEGVAVGQDGTGDDGDGDDLEAGRGAAAKGGKAKKGEGKAGPLGIEIGLNFLGSSGGMSRIKNAIENKKKYISYLDELIEEKEQLKSRLEPRGWKYWGDSRTAYLNSPVHEDWVVAARTCNAFDVMPAGWARKFTRSKGWVLQHLHSDRYFIDTPEERETMAEVVGRDVIWGKLWTGR